MTRQAFRARLRKLERDLNPPRKRGDLTGLAEAMAKAGREADEREAAGLPRFDGESSLERYHRIKHSEDPAEKAEAERLAKFYWPHLCR